MTYFNTTSLAGDELDTATYKAMNQEDQILDFYLKHPWIYTPEQIQGHVLPHAPLTSVRRAMSNLTKMGMLEKTNTKLKGGYGRKCHDWCLSETVVEVMEDL
jgi:hypothetical protein